MQRRRDPREPTPLVLMNPELRVRQLRYAANIEATLMVPLHRYYEVLLDLSMMGLEYLKAMKLERAFIIFKRIEYFIFHRLSDHPGSQSFSSEAKTKIMGRLPMIMYVAQQIIVDFIMPVYERQAAYFRYEELQRRLSIVNPTAWNAIMPEAARRESEFYSEAEKISSRFGVELSSFLPREITPDDNHPSNYPPRTFPAKLPPRIRGSEEEVSAQLALNVAINSMNSTAESITISGDQPIETLVQNINAMMNTALLNFFTARQNYVSRFPDALFPEATVSELSSKQLSQVNHLSSTIVFDMAQNDIDDRRNSYSPGVDHMYRMPSELPGSLQSKRSLVKNEDRNPFEYSPTYSVDTYIDFLNITYESNSSVATGYRVNQIAHEEKPSPSTAGFMLHLEELLEISKRKKVNPRIAPEFLISSLESTSSIIPEADPGPPRGSPPTAPLLGQETDSNHWGVWAKRGLAFRPGGMGSLGVLSNLDRAREVLDSVPPMPKSIEYSKPSSMLSGKSPRTFDVSKNSVVGTSGIREKELGTSETSRKRVTLSNDCSQTTEPRKKVKCSDVRANST